MKLNVGAGALRLPGYLNVDVRDVGSDSRKGHAGDLSFAEPGTVDVIFSHAVFEHVFPAHRLAVLREWQRVLAPSGAVICLGLPDFPAVARLYLDGASGVTGQTFDLFEVYRYTHGHPEMMSAPTWSSWNPMKRADEGPSGYVPQLHKGLFDGDHLSALLHAVGLPGSIVRSVYPGEQHSVNIGFVAGPGCDNESVAARHLSSIPVLDRIMAQDTVSWAPLAEPHSDRFVDEILRLEASPPRSALRQAASRVKRALRS